MTEADARFLGADLALVGDDGWGDAGFGNAASTPVELNDFHLIEDLAGLGRAELVGRLNALGAESAARLAPKLAQAAAARGEVIVVTHVPPFWEASWHEGRPSNADWVPWFACRATGEVVLACAREHPATGFTVLCGHTHGAGTWQAAPNLTVHTAGARYGEPCVQRVIEVVTR